MEIDHQIQSKNTNKKLKIDSPIHKMETWPSSRIVRVSRGGKDRHSKVVTSKGLRDRRVRLSVTTAIQFYDLQDRLGFDQPSKALEWLLKAADSSITELPPIGRLFLDTPKILNDEKMSSPSENSKNSGLRSDEKEKEDENDEKGCLNLNPNLSQTTSFTELLSSRSTVKNEANVFDKMPQRNWSSSSPMDYFTGGFLATPVTSPVFSDQHQQFTFSPEGNKYNNESSEYNLNFTISNSGNSSGLNRGTLQSNVSNGSFPSFVFENQQHHFFSGQLCFGEAQANNNNNNNNNNNGQKGKRKN